MNTITKNREVWSGFDWEGTGMRGDRWSGGHGSPEAQWFFSVYPRIHKFLPAGVTCEIAPGFGRWTHYLLQQCETLIGVDLTERCVQACQERFRGNHDASFVVNDGLHLTGVADASIDFVFTMDSLVHCDRSVVKSYVEETLRVLKPSGTAFFHHSNLDGVPEAKTDSRYRIHWRSPDVSAETVKRTIEAGGGHAHTQELVNWAGSPYLIDCYTVFSRLPPKAEFRRFSNSEHMKEMEIIRTVQSLLRSNAALGLWVTPSLPSETVRQAVWRRRCASAAAIAIAKTEVETRRDLSRSVAG